MKKLPLYQCHKQVRAAKILTVEVIGTDTTTDENEIVKITFEDAAIPTRSCSLARKPKPAAGWYLVEYEDGYFSFSPAGQFEQGYTLVDEEEQEPERGFEIGDVVIFSEASGNADREQRYIVAIDEMNESLFYTLSGLHGSLFLARSLKRV